MLYKVEKAMKPSRGKAFSCFCEFELQPIGCKAFSDFFC
jgi:hypothetical protein